MATADRPNTDPSIMPEFKTLFPRLGRAAEFMQRVLHTAPAENFMSEHYHKEHFEPAPTGGAPMLDAQLFDDREF